MHQIGATNHLKEILNETKCKYKHLDQVSQISETSKYFK
jgi:hypothetical protein